MPEIFNRVPLSFGGSFSADGASMYFGDVNNSGALSSLTQTFPLGGPGLLTQNINVQYAQPINRIYEIGTNFTYFVAGRTQGNMSIGRIIGPAQLAIGFYAVYGDVCAGPTRSILFAGAAGCGEDTVTSIDNFATNGFAFLIVGPLLQSIGLSVAAQDMVINEQVQMMFVSLLIPDQNGEF